MFRFLQCVGSGPLCFLGPEATLGYEKYTILWASPGRKYIGKWPGTKQLPGGFIEM
jgi:hypothetical protein